MINLALIGLGSMGKNYIKTLNEFKDARIIKTYSRKNDYKNLAREKNISGVIIATPASTHFQIANYLVNQGFPLLVEKPLTTSLKDAKKLLALQQKKHVPVLVGHTLLYHPVVWQMKKILTKIGAIKHLEFEGASNNSRVDTSLFFDWGPHPVSLFIDILKSQPKKIEVFDIRKKKGVIEQAKVKLVFPNKITGSISLSWNSRNKKRKFRVTGEWGEIIFDDFSSKKLELIDNKKNQIIYPKYKITKPLNLLVKEFINSIRKKTKIYSDLSLGVKVINILEKIEDSAKKSNL